MKRSGFIRFSRFHHKPMNVFYSPDGHSNNATRHNIKIIVNNHILIYDNLTIYAINIEFYLITDIEKFCKNSATMCGNTKKK